MVLPIILFMLLRVLKNRYYIACISSAIALQSLLYRIYIYMNVVSIDRLYYGLIPELARL
jgi:hypothetical protein